jgi:hypothetical protein
MFRGRYEPVARLRELRLPKADRGAARAERRAVHELRVERDNQYTAERRAAARDAESRRDSNFYGSG